MNCQIRKKFCMLKKREFIRKEAKFQMIRYILFFIMFILTLFLMKSLTESLMKEKILSLKIFSQLRLKGTKEDLFLKVTITILSTKKNIYNLLRISSKKCITLILKALKLLDQEHKTDML